MKALLRRVPGLVTTYRHAQIVASAAYERWWADRQEMNDRSILSGEWRFDLPHEQERYRSVLAAVEARRGTSGWGDALEIGCAEGLFTTELLGRCVSVAAYDVSAVACERTIRRVPQARVQHLDIERDLLPGTFDLVFAMCVLSYIHGRDRLGGVSAKLAGALRPGGLLVVNDLRLHEPRMEHAWWARALAEGGLQLLTFFDGRDGLRLVHRDVHPRYVIGVYERKG